MPPPSFASAAAGSTPNQPSTRDPGSEWPRRTNGATQTFRRPSGATFVMNPNQQPDAATPSQPAARYVPPHRNGTHNDMRYTKDQMLEVFRAQQGANGGLQDGLSGLYVGGWQPDGTNGSGSAGWGRADHARDAQPGPDVCWDRNGTTEPRGMYDMDDEERELFSNSVNTPLKATTTTNKESHQANGMSGRRTSTSNTTPGGPYGLPSPSLARGNGRRRDTSDSYPFPSNPLASPGGGNGRDDQRAPSPPPSLLRRRTDLKDLDSLQNGDDKGQSSPFGGLKRHQTGPLSAGLGGPSSPWSTNPQSAGMPPMGSFGNFGLGGQTGASGDKRPGLGGGRAESRSKNLLSKDSTEDFGSPTVTRKASVSSLSKVGEHESWRPQHDRADVTESGEDMLTGSAALAAGSDLSPPTARAGVRGFGTPSRTATHDDYGFGAFGMTTDTAPTFGQTMMQGRDSYQHTPGQQRAGPYSSNKEPMSPTDTNPYRSPEQHIADRMVDDMDTNGHDNHKATLPGLGGLGGFGHDQMQQLGGLGAMSGLPNLGRGPGAASDRSQNSSVAGNRGFGGLGGLGQLGGGPGAAGWSSTQPGFGTPGRQAANLATAFGGGIFASSMAELQSPSLAGLGGAGLMSPQMNGGLGGSRMANMFPQEQPRPNEHRTEDRDMQQLLGSLGGEGARDPGPPFGSALGDVASDNTSAGEGHSAQQQPPGSSASNQPPAAQQRTMVMPDRMRWIYRDPQGQTQGPWSGLEMHDWYKAGFFSPELLVKKYEDQDYEPLAQLIRRIGNSREPFLVPQIGIPHGSSTGAGPTTWAGAGGAGVVGTGPVSAGGAQPPFASSFPSFGTTLTADQQNALERRKQEEQYLMARQKEHLAQAQIASRVQMGGPGHHGLMPSQGHLNHQSSMQSLHSQPSFGSISSPANAFQPSPSQGPAGGAGFFDNSFRAPQSGGLGAVGADVDSLGHIREEEIPGIMDRLDLGERNNAGQFGAPGQPIGQQQSSQEQQVQMMLEDRARLQQEQAKHDASQRDVPSNNERLQQFQQLQGQQAGAGLGARFQPAVGKAAAGEKHTQPSASTQKQAGRSIQPLSLTEQVEAAVSAQHSPAIQQLGFPQPFPPTSSQSPLLAPAAQRTGRQSVADQLQTESRDLSQTPSSAADTASHAAAPWAKEPVEAAKGPSLREIQEVEAKKAAQAEALASAARRAAFDKEMEAQAAAAAVAPAAPGLAATSSWATGSPATPTNASAAAWAKPAQKPTGNTAKTMAQIQKEEEARKKRVVAAAASAQAAATGGVAVPVGKSYANLAGKITIPPPNAGAASWTTVGASGKLKTPATPATPSTPRVASSGNAPPTQGTIKKMPSRNMSLTAGGVNAQDELRKWAIAELRSDVKKGVSVEDIVSNVLPNLVFDMPLLIDTIHTVTINMDSRHFAEEYIRRKKLADKGMWDNSVPPKSASPAHGAASSQAGEWSQVAKKGPVKEAPKDESNGSFRVVPAKKGAKGSKRS